MGEEMYKMNLEHIVILERKELTATTRVVSK